MIYYYETRDIKYRFHKSYTYINKMQFTVSTSYFDDLLLKNLLKNVNNIVIVPISPIIWEKKSLIAWKC